MAAYLGMTERAYRHLESGTRNPSKETIDKLEDLFGVPQRELLALNSTPRKKVTTMPEIDIAALKEQIRREILDEIQNFGQMNDTPWAQVKRYMSERFGSAGFYRTANGGIELYNAAAILIKKRLGLRNITQIRSDQVQEAQEIIDTVFQIIHKGGAA